MTRSIIYLTLTAIIAVSKLFFDVSLWLVALPVMSMILSGAIDKFIFIQKLKKEDERSNYKG